MRWIAAVAAVTIGLSASPARAETTVVGVNTGEEGILAVLYEEPSLPIDLRHEVRSSCEYKFQGRPFSNRGTLTVTGRTKVGPHHGLFGPSSATIRCVVKVGTTVVLDEQRTASGSTVTIEPRVHDADFRSFTICTQGRGTWQDGDERDTGLKCKEADLVS
jgi:hypothetical protein